MVILEDKKTFLLDKKNKEYFPRWICKLIDPKDDDERNNINEKIKAIPEFLSLNEDY